MSHYESRHRRRALAGRARDVIAGIRWLARLPGRALAWVTAGTGPGACCIRCERTGAGPCEGCYCHDDVPRPETGTGGRAEPGRGPGHPCEPDDLDRLVAEWDYCADCPSPGWCREHGCQGATALAARYGPPAGVIPAAKVAGVWLPLSGERVSGTLDDTDVFTAPRLCARREAANAWREPTQWQRWKEAAGGVPASLAYVERILSLPLPQLLALEAA